jgi:hypothetical protein
MMDAIHAGNDIEESIADVATMAALFKALFDEYLDLVDVLRSHNDYDHIEWPFLEELVFGLDSAVKAYKSLERGVGGGRS